MKLQHFDKYTCVKAEHSSYLTELCRLAEKDPWHPNSHICPPCGLLNDPNGLAYFGGEYHVFYQWYPFAPSHGMKHWAHVKSQDLQRWNWDERILAPDREYEKNGCYSGNAIEKDGKLYLFYTANYKTENGRIPKQAMAVMEPDGEICKYEGNPVIDGAPMGMSGDIRDPFVFERDGIYWMLLGAADTEGKGRLIAYRSQELHNWEYAGSISVDGIPLGTMVECPGIIRVDDKDVLFLSLIGIKPEKNRFHNRFSTVYAVGNLDLEHMKFCTEYWDEADGGFDFYAPQPFYGKNGVPMLFGWFGCGEQELPDDEFQWRHGLTMPRILKLEKGRLHMLPARETADGFQNLPMEELGKWHAKSVAFHVELGGNGNTCPTIALGPEEDQVLIRIDRMNQIITLDRSRLKIPVDPEYGMKRSVELSTDGMVSLDIYEDKSFYEIYINGGEKVFTFRAFEEALAPDFSYVF